MFGAGHMELNMEIMLTDLIKYKCMDKKIALVISPNWHDYARKYLRDCIESVRKQDYEGEIKIYLTDNETSPKSYKLLRRLAPEAELVLNISNDGFAKGCNDSIKLALQEDFEYIFLVNMDTVLDKSCLKKLVEYADKNTSKTLVQPRIMLWDKKDTINSLGNNIHFLGFGFCRGYNEKWDDIKDKVKEEVMYPSGAGILFRVSELDRIGLFDEELWMYNEDQDIGWKTWLSGKECAVAIDAVLYHKYEFAKSIKQYYYMDRNRIVEILKNFKIGTLLLILPAFILMEVGLILFSLKSGWFKEKIKVWKYFMMPSTWAYLLRERKKIKKLRIRYDREILPMISGKIWYQEIDDWKLKIINPFFNLYWNIVKKIIFW